MKKFLSLLVALLSFSSIIAFGADPAANIHIRISGAVKDNTYFLCIPNVGCLSILAAEEGKIYPVYHPLEIDGLYVTNIDHNFKLSEEGLPSSCHVTVQPNQTVTISGSIRPAANGGTLLAGLNCRVS